MSDSSPSSLLPENLPLEWKVGPSDSLEAPPEEWYPATVPGAVQLDYARAHAWPPYWEGNEFERYEWMERRFWHYEAEIDDAGSGHLAEGLVHFRCGGIDYRWTLYLNDRELLDREGMFRPVLLNLSDHGVRPGDRLRIVIHPIPKNGDLRGRWEADRTCKPPCSWGWDWHPRLVPSGIWEEASLTVARGTILDLEVGYRLNETLESATVSCRTRHDAVGPVRLRTCILDPQGRTVAESRAEGADAAGRLDFELSSIQLWWPHDQGDPARYTVVVELLDADDRCLDRRTRSIGFRQVRLVMHEPEWASPSDFPKSRSRPPITLEINGRRIFAKGSNWVPPEIFPGLLDEARYRQHLERAVAANFNLLRVWGGGVINKEAFYALCDKLGIMVWTEFPLACLTYEDDDAYLAVLEKEATAIIRRVRQHPSQVLWCGGNELFNSWSGMTDQSKALRLLNALCYREDPDTPFLPTAPVFGMGHGPYLFRDPDGREIYHTFNDSDYTAYTEFGCPGPASEETLRRFLPEQEWWPPKPGTAWETHHGFGAWVYGTVTTWLSLEIIEHYFGPPANLGELIERGQWLQAEGFKYMFEESRRQKPRCAMALNWCFNEPWPTAANNSLISWPDVPKPAYHAVASACRPTALSARLPHFQWHNDDIFEAEVWLLHDGPDPVPEAEVRARVEVGSWSTETLVWPSPGTAANENLRGPALSCRLPDLPEARELLLHLECASRPGWNQTYRLSYRGGRPAPKYGVAARKSMNT